MNAAAVNSRITLAVVALIAISVCPVAAAADECFICHVDEDMADRARLPAEGFRGDVHSKAGMGCSDCHGGRGDDDDFRKAHSRKAGFRSRPPAAEIAELCGACHDDDAKMSAFGVKDRETGQARRFGESVHGRIQSVEGFEQPTCISCHGVHGIRSPGDRESSVHATRVPETCARCHSDLRYMRAFTSARVRVDQLIEYRTSIHGELLAKGDEKVAVCSSCHGSHDILPATDQASRVHPLNVAGTCGECHSDPQYMAGYQVSVPGGGTRPILTNQLEEYRGSVHHHALTEGGDLSAPTCNDCHGNHGATPPEVRTVATVCAQCHSRPAELFGPSSLKAELESSGQAECSACHGHHGVVRPGDSLLEGIAGGTTTSGWVPDPAGVEIARAYLHEVRRLKSEIERVEMRVVRTETYGMDLTRAHLSLNRARDRLIQARVLIHSFDPGPLNEAILGSEEEPDTGALDYTASAEALVETALRERTTRRLGLWAALAVIVLLIVALVFRIRQIEAESSSNVPEPGA